MSDITLVDPSESYSVSLNIFVDDKDIDKIVLLIINN